MSTATKPRVLVVAPQWVGDAIMSLPLLAQLKDEQHCIDVLAVPAVEAVFRCHPAVHKLIIAPFAHGKLQWALRHTIAKKIRGRYDKAIILPNSLKSALIPWLARIPVRRGARGEARYLLINDQRAMPQVAAGAKGRPSMLDQYLCLADRPRGSDAIDRFGEHRPRMAIPPDATSWGQHDLDDASLRAMHLKQLLALCPGAEYGPAKQWPAHHFADVARAWIESSDERAVLIIGGPKDRAIANEIAAGIGHTTRVMNLTGKTNLLEAFRWISISTVALSNDSGLMHAAAALDIPVVGMFGSSDPEHTPPHSPQSRVLSLRLSCSPCFQRVCPLGTTACLNDLSPKLAIRAINDLVADAPAAHGAGRPASP